MVVTVYVRDSDCVDDDYGVIKIRILIRRDGQKLCPWPR